MARINIDPSDVQKPYAKKMQYLAKVWDGSKGRVGDNLGYWGCMAVACEPGKRRGVVPLQFRLWSTEDPEYKGENAEIIDRIEVQNPDGLVEPDLWVAFLVQGDGIKNDIDFSNQPYLWLSAPKSKSGWQNDYQTLNGTLTPYGDTYKFGYNFVHYTENTCLAVDGLCDKADGTPRNVVFRGFSTHTLGKNLTFTGRIRIEDGAFLNVNGTSGLGPIPAEERTNQIVIAGTNCGFSPRGNSMTFSEKIGITIESGAAVAFYPSGSVEEGKEVIAKPRR